MQRSTGGAQEFHDREMHAPLHPTVWVHQVTQPTLVLGSTQKISLLRVNAARRAGYLISTRRSGGGLVLVSPGSSCWIDLLLPTQHELWDDDVSAAFYWVGQLWVDTLTTLGITKAKMHRGALLRKQHGRVLCFAGLGPGEVTIDDSKIVGLSQRRTRAGARFQGLLVTKWDSAPLRQFVVPKAWPEGLEPEMVQVGHPSITAQVLHDLPDVLLAKLNQM